MMQGSHGEAIIQIIIALIGVLGFFGLIGAFFIYAIMKAKKRKRMQAELAAQMGGSATTAGANANQPNVSDDGAQILPVKYASEKKFNAFIKLFPWEASGVLRITDQQIMFQGATESGSRPINIMFDPLHASTKWIGIKLINGATSWFELEQAGSRHYFTAETGVTVFGTQSGTDQIMQAVNARLYAARQQPQFPPQM